MRLSRGFVTALALAGTIAAGACSDSVGPGDVNPDSFADKLDDLAATFENNVAFQSLKTLSGHFPVYGALTAALATLPDQPSGEPSLFGSAGRASRVRALASLRAPDGVLALFPTDVLGKTLEWDAAGDTYVIGTRSGAPANGIRILLYAVNPTTGQPIEPVQELGSLDLVDESTPQQDQLGVVLRLGGTTVADYDITAAIGTTSAAVGAQGYIRRPDGSGRVDFDLDLNVNLSTGVVTINYAIDGSDGTSIDLQLVANETQANVLLRVSRGRNSIEISGTETSQGFSGVIKFNGTVIANLSGDPGDPVITGAEGRTLTADEVEALRRILLRFEDFLSDFTDGLFAPGAVVFGS